MTTTLVMPMPRCAGLGWSGACTEGHPCAHRPLPKRCVPQQQLQLRLWRRCPRSAPHTPPPQVVCQQLGLGDSGKAYPGAKFGQGAGPIWLDDVNCTGAEPQLEACEHLPWGKGDCDHTEDVGVRCFG